MADEPTKGDLVMVQFRRGPVERRVSHRKMCIQCKNLVFVTTDVLDGSLVVERQPNDKGFHELHRCLYGRKDT